MTGGMCEGEGRNEGKKKWSEGGSIGERRGEIYGDKIHTNVQHLFTRTAKYSNRHKFQYYYYE